jgi:hypothetical protein
MIVKALRVNEMFECTDKYSRCVKAVTDPEGV